MLGACLQRGRWVKGCTFPAPNPTDLWSLINRGLLGLEGGKVQGGGRVGSWEKGEGRREEKRREGLGQVKWRWREGGRREEKR